MQLWQAVRAWWRRYPPLVAAPPKHPCGRPVPFVGHQSPMARGSALPRAQQLRQAAARCAPHGGLCGFHGGPCGWGVAFWNFGPASRSTERGAIKVRSATRLGAAASKGCARAMIRPKKKNALACLTNRIMLLQRSTDSRIFN